VLNLFLSRFVCDSATMMEKLAASPIVIPSRPYTIPQTTTSNVQMKNQMKNTTPKSILSNEPSYHLTVEMPIL